MDQADEGSCNICFCHNVPVSSAEHFQNLHTWSGPGLCPLPVSDLSTCLCLSLHVSVHLSLSKHLCLSPFVLSLSTCYFTCLSIIVSLYTFLYLSLSSSVSRSTFNSIYPSLSFQEKYPTVVSLPEGLVSEVMTLSPPELPR